MSDVLTARDGGVLTVTLNRPAQLNALTLGMEQRYLRAILDADADPEVRAIVVTGAGRGFCAGADMSMLAAVTAGQAEGAEVAGPLPEGPPVRKLDLLRLRKPLIAAVGGPCVGLGFVHALYCDLRVAGPETSFATVFARRGLTAEYGLSWLLPRLLGRGRALDLLLSGRTVGGEEALRIGLAELAAPAGGVLDTALNYAHDLAANCSPASMATIKAQVQRDATTDLAAAHDHAEQLMLASFTSPDALEGVHSWVDKRPPRFPPLG